MTVLTARAAEYEDGYAWGVVTQLFDSELRTSSAGTREDAATLAARALIQPERPRDEDAYAVLHGLYWLTADIAQRAPLLLAIDDLQWADPPSQRFLAHLARATICDRPGQGADRRPGRRAWRADGSSGGAQRGRLRAAGGRRAWRRSVGRVPCRLPRADRRQPAAAARPADGARRRGHRRHGRGRPAPAPADSGLGLEARAAAAWQNAGRRARRRQGSRRARHLGDHGQGRPAGRTRRRGVRRGDRRAHGR